MMILIVESETGEFQPVAVVSSESEGREIARVDFARRLADPENSMCPYVYRVWAQRENGEYASIAEVLQA